ncbi:unnamed protein product [Paramecium octaurelia]|uniref:Ribosomal protein S4 n=1 Tax=Paramecium octaurelia TaxID=43137 RepID=A0A8S1SH70_PAROT|nr:unnamed protein product [Paramecium octaurelia]
MQNGEKNKKQMSVFQRSWTMGQSLRKMILLRHQNTQKILLHLIRKRRLINNLNKLLGRKQKNIFGNLKQSQLLQVYRAKLNGEYVAIKVRHPNIIDKIVMDRYQIFIQGCQCFQLNFTIRQQVMPIKFQELRKPLANQTDLRLKRENLKGFFYCDKLKNIHHLVHP